MMQPFKTKINNNFHNFCSDNLSISITMALSIFVSWIERSAKYLNCNIKKTNTEHKLDALLLTVSCSKKLASMYTH
jgi:hypothetical protein